MVKQLDCISFMYDNIQRLLVPGGQMVEQLDCIGFMFENIQGLCLKMIKNHWVLEVVEHHAGVLEAPSQAKLCWCIQTKPPI